MVSLNELPLLALGIVILAGLGFLLWALYRLACEAHCLKTTRRSR